MKKFTGEDFREIFKHIQRQGYLMVGAGDLWEPEYSAEDIAAQANQLLEERKTHKNELRMGDRVKVYGLNLASQPISFKAKIIGINGDLISVQGDNYPGLKPSLVHRKQVRRLK